MTDTAGKFDAWLGKTESRTEVIGPNPLRGFAALLDRPETPAAAGAPLPPLWHWFYFLEMTPQSEIAHDGHAKKGGFLPPIELPRRMWAGSRFRFHHPLRVGETVTRRSRIDGIDFKRGRSGQLAFVEVGHEYDSPAGLAFSERHDIVYREARSVAAAAPGGASKSGAATTPSPKPAPTEADFTRESRADAIVLFRYSALTFNAHRIHFDRDYVREVEGYPGLLVHGPLLATLLIDELLRRFPGRPPLEYSFRVLHPVFDNETFKICGRGPDDGGRAKLWIANEEGALCLDGAARLGQGCLMHS